VEVQPLIVAVPGLTHPSRALEENKRYIRTAQIRADGKPGRPGSDDDRVGLSRHFPILHTGEVD
jgi:hypothetical protein